MTEKLKRRPMLSRRKLLTAGALGIAGLVLKEQKSIKSILAPTPRIRIEGKARHGLEKRPVLPKRQKSKRPDYESELELPAGVTGYEGMDTAMIVKLAPYRDMMQSVEQKYGLPKDIIALIVMHESWVGSDMVNETDGGVGMAHMQTSEAARFGMRVFGSDKAMAADRKLSHPKVGKALEKQWDDYNNPNIKGPYPQDERFDPFMGLDLIGRYLAYHFCGPRFEALSVTKDDAAEHKLDEMTTTDQAIAWYCGRRKYNNRGFNNQENDEEAQSYKMELEIMLERLDIDRKQEIAADWFEKKYAGVMHKGKQLTLDVHAKAFQDHYRKLYNLDEYEKEKFELIDVKGKNPVDDIRKIFKESARSTSVWVKSR